MVDRSPRLNLPRPEATDPFRREDFVEAYNILDANPGIYVAEDSGSRPAWGAAHSGRMIYERSTNRLLVWEPPEGWIDLRHVPMSWTGGTQPETTLPRNQATTFDILSFTAPRDGRMIMWGSTRVSKDAGITHSASAYAYCNGADISLGTGEFFRSVDNSTSMGINQTMILPIWGWQNVVKGTLYKVQCRVVAGDYAGSVIVNNLRAFAMLTRTV